MSTSADRLSRSLEDIRELEGFLHALIPTLNNQGLRDGENVLPYAEKMKIKIPPSLERRKITWKAEYADLGHRHEGDPLVLVRPGDANAVGLTIGCVDIGDAQVCLECGWLYCRVVIYGRF